MISIQELYKIYLDFPSVQTDTRALKNGDLFFALKGPNFNGNNFIQMALEAGAAYAVSDEDRHDDPRILQVPDVLDALQQLANFHRQQFSIPFIAITGSNGKTTTKELIHAALSKKFKTYTTEGNLNNHIGIPLTILKIKNDAEMAVVEMGANHLKEIELYCKIVQPTHGVITNCGKAHLEGFGGEEGVRKGKGELFDWLKSSGGSAFVNSDLPYLESMSNGIERIYRYGTIEGIITGQIKDANPFLQISIEKMDGIKTIQTNLAGKYNLPNVLCASAIAHHFKVPGPMLKEAIENYFPSNSRSQIIQKNSNTILFDAYNANPDSMLAAIQNFAEIKHENKILLLGAMKELGEKSLEEHKNLLTEIRKYSWKDVVLVGGDFEKIPLGNFLFFSNSDEAGKWLQEKNITNAYLLVKGSRATRMEKVMEGLEG
ncbi:MAG: UDP-N-acetylmuramoyl-tripeptide--D-alanyl-D-alanine ligase [Bacteroidota bacterium]